MARGRNIHGWCTTGLEYWDGKRGITKGCRMLDLDIKLNRELQLSLDMFPSKQPRSSVCGAPLVTECSMTTPSAGGPITPRQTRRALPNSYCRISDGLLQLSIPAPMLFCPLNVTWSWPEKRIEGFNFQSRARNDCLFSIHNLASSTFATSGCSHTRLPSNQVRQTTVSAISSHVMMSLSNWMKFAFFPISMLPTS